MHFFTRSSACIFRIFCSHSVIIFPCERNSFVDWACNKLLLALLATSCALFMPVALPGQAVDETLPTGSFIINMGVVPQTIANGLKPYGLIYDLTKNYSTPIKWVINQTKVKDGIDFSHNGVDYRGSAFIIPADYRTPSVDARIVYWQSLGVVGATTVSPITVPVYATLRAAPRWTMDKQNGPIAVAYMVNAGIPPSAYGGSTPNGWDLPADLDECDDIFVMPHADPTWETHKNLLYWNRDYDGDIWEGCHAVSVCEGLSNPLNPAERMNFLTTNGLVHFSDHDDGSPPYTHSYPSDPVMQFIGIVDAAMQNGSEQAFLPLPGSAWLPSTHLGVWDPTQSDVPAISPGPAAMIAYGRAFGDENRGLILYQASHRNDKGTAGDVPAQRAYFNFCLLSAKLREIVPDISILPDTFYSGNPTVFSFTLPPGYDPADFTVQWSTSCGGTFSPNSTQQTVTYTPPASQAPSNCVVSVNIYDVCGREFKNSESVVLLCQLSAIATATNPSCNGSANGSISLNISGSPAPYSYNWTRGVVTGSGTGTNISGLIAGTYQVTVTAANGCAKALTVVLTQPSALSVSLSPVNIQCQGAATGSISLTPSGGTPAYSYLWGGGVVTQHRSGLVAGTYSVTVTDAMGCTATASATLTQPSALTLTLTPTHINCFGASTGDISLTASGGTPGYSYNWGGGVTTQNRTNIPAGNYIVTVTDANACTKTASVTLTQPAAALSLATVVTHISCGVGSGAINLTPFGGTAPYTYSWTGGITTEDRSGLSAGTYSVTVTDNKGCTATTAATVSQTPALSLSAAVTQIPCYGGTGSINLTVSGGTPSFAYSWSNGAILEDISGLGAGTYAVTVTDLNGCTSNLTAVVSAAPAALNLTASFVQVACFNGATGSIDLSVTGGTPTYTYDWSNDGPESPDNDLQDLTGLTAGSYTVTVTDSRSCTAQLSQTITQPPLLVLSVDPTDVTCIGGSDGAINLSVTGGTSPYSYDWSNDGMENPDNDTQDLSGLSAGTYTVVVTDAGGCTASISVVLTELNPLPPPPGTVHH